MDVTNLLLARGEIDVPINVVAAGEEGMVRTAPEDGHRSLQAQNDARPVRDIQDAISLDFKRPVIHHLPPVIPANACPPVMIASNQRSAAGPIRAPPSGVHKLLLALFGN